MSERVGIEVRATGLRRAHRGRVVLEVPSLSLPAGQVTAVLGPSGAGKSTLLGIVGLLERPDAGTVEFDGRLVGTRDRDARLRTSAVFQRPFLFKGTVGANVAYGLRLRGVVASERERRVAGALERVGLAGWEQRSALTLSGGEAQRVALARALVLEPQILLLDEPLASLDPVLKHRVAREFAELFANTRSTVLYVTHDQDEAMTVAGRVVVMRDGHVMSEGVTADVMGLAADEWSARFLGVEPAARGTVAESDNGLVRVACDGVDLYAVSDLPPGTAVLVGVRPEDVMLFDSGADLPASSARNRIVMRVVDLEPRGGVVRLALQAGGVRFAATVSRASALDLALARDSRVLALIKATAVRVRQDRATA
ncbi:MAG: ABC transporter ATP-binding protein [Actinobacteria bacterium]|nr:MAG: ABC transporter ATP-binding protein [Actinomycetota bacterium]